MRKSFLTLKAVCRRKRTEGILSAGKNEKEKKEYALQGDFVLSQSCAAQSIRQDITQGPIPTPGKSYAGSGFVHVYGLDKTRGIEAST